MLFVLPPENKRQNHNKTVCCKLTKLHEHEGSHFAVCCETSWLWGLIRATSWNFIAKRRATVYLLQKTLSTCSKLYILLQDKFLRLVSQRCCETGWVILLLVLPHLKEYSKKHGHAFNDVCVYMALSFICMRNLLRSVLRSGNRGSFLDSYHVRRSKTACPFLIFFFRKAFQLCYIFCVMTDSWMSDSGVQVWSIVCLKNDPQRICPVAFLLYLK